MTPDEHLAESLRFAAKAADRGEAGERLRPEFERRLNELGYGPRAIALAFNGLIGPDTVAETLAALARNARMERTEPVRLDFEIVDEEPGLPREHSLVIAGVEHAPQGIRITYEIRPPLPSPASRPDVEARDDRDRDYAGLGQHFGLVESEGGTINLGGLTVPIPPQDASLMRVRMSWGKGPGSLWARPAQELRIHLH